MASSPRGAAREGSLSSWRCWGCFQQFHSLFLSTQTRDEFCWLSECIHRWSGHPSRCHFWIPSRISQGSYCWFASIIQIFSFAIFSTQINVCLSGKSSICTIFHFRFTTERSQTCVYASHGSGLFDFLSLIMHSWSCKSKRHTKIHSYAANCKSLSPLKSSTVSLSNKQYGLFRFRRKDENRFYSQQRQQGCKVHWPRMGTTFGVWEPQICGAHDRIIGIIRRQRHIAEGGIPKTHSVMHSKQWMLAAKHSCSLDISHVFSPTPAAPTLVIYWHNIESHIKPKWIRRGFAFTCEDDADISWKLVRTKPSRVCLTHLPSLMLR